MPEIARFYGIIIKMFFGDHNPPHIHAVYGEYNGIFHIETLAMLNGDLPPRAIQLIQEWMTEHQQELSNMWQTQKISKLQGLK